MFSNGPQINQPFFGSCMGSEGTSSATIQLAKQSDSSNVTFNICEKKRRGGGVKK